jgi:hypothetical protein
MEKLLWATATGVVLFVARQWRERDRADRRQWAAAGWIVVWLVGLGVVSKLSPFGKGTGTISFAWSFPVLLLLSAAIYLLAVRTRLPRAVVDTER